MATTNTTPDVQPAVNPPPLRIGDLIIDPPILQAPMAGFTNAAFRQIVRDFGGAGLLATEMVNARGFVWLDENEAEHPDRLWGVADEPRPLAVQIWDNDPDTMAKVGKRLAEEYQVSVVDINFGCPVRQVTEKAHSGSYLLREPQRMFQIISRLVQVCSPTPVTAKIRLGCSPDNINCNEVARVVEEAGAAALTVHGRTAKDMFRGCADWDRISEIKSHLKAIPLIGNGDLDTAQKVVAAFRQYNVDAVMIARACLGRPWLFAQAAAAIRGQPIPPEPTLVQQKDVMLNHYRLVVERFGEEKGTVLMRKYACCYAQGKYGARHFRSHVAKVSTADQFHQVVRDHFPAEPGNDTDQPARDVDLIADQCPPSRLQEGRTQ
ncbi:MAG: tRNA dihydrouridine synthase DusB [Planctomycetota bacterium]